MIYVHASGLNRDPKNNPENFEHFGITVLEAMIFGCYPIVFSVGGPAELVGITGVGATFNSQNQLVRVLASVLSKPQQELIAMCESSALASQVFVDKQISNQLPAII
jgi:glycosyltransferase involved in cell wall biosynthesis